MVVFGSVYLGLGRGCRSVCVVKRVFCGCVGVSAAAKWVRRRRRGGVKPSHAPRPVSARSEPTCPPLPRPLLLLRLRPLRPTLPRLPSLP